MAFAAVKILVKQALADGRYSLSDKGASAPDATTILTDITAALAVTAIAGDPTSTTAVTLVQTDATALIATFNGDVNVIWNTSTVTHRNQLRKALLRALELVNGGYGGLAE